MSIYHKLILWFLDCLGWPLLTRFLQSLWGFEAHPTIAVLATQQGAYREV
jgi:hypothetical protein